MELLKVCHKQTSPITLTTSGNEAFVRFQSDDDSQKKRFKATYKKIESSTCLFCFITIFNDSIFM